MTIAEQVRNVLTDEYKRGDIQQEMAKRHNVSQQYISQLISGKKPCDGLTARKLNQMFPGATLNLTGDTVTVNSSGDNNGTLIGVNHGTVASASVETFRNRAIASVMELDIPAEAALAVLRLLRDLR